MTVDVINSSEEQIEKRMMNFRASLQVTSKKAV